MLDRKGDAHPSSKARHTKIQLLWNAIFHDQQWMGDILRLKWCKSKKHCGQRALEDFSVKSLLYVIRTIAFTIVSVLVTIKRRNMLFTLDLVAVLCHCHGRVQNLALLFSPEFAQALYLRWLEIGNGHWPVHRETLATSRTFASGAAKICCRLEVGLKDPQMELFQYRICKCKPVAESFGAETPDK